MDNSSKNKVNAAIIILAVSLLLVGIVHFVNHLDLSLDISLELPKPDEKVTLNGIYFDTPVSITLYRDSIHNRKDCEAAIKKAFELCDEYTYICSSKDEKSELYKLNETSRLNKTNTGTENTGTVHNSLNLKISRPLYDMISESLKAHDKYCSDFDITIEPLLVLWDFGSKYGKDKFDASPVPDEAAIAEALKNVDSSKITLSEDGNGYYIHFPAGTTIDLGACAKGYIGDRIAELLKKEGFKNAVINLGGNITCLGNAPDREGYKIGIKDPFDKDKTVTVVRDIDNSSVITSGIYERCFEYEGKFYHHILSASTGMSADTDLVSATVISDSGVEADILSTCMILMGSENAMKLVEELKGTEAILVTKDGKVLKSSLFN